MTSAKAKALGVFFVKVGVSLYVWRQLAARSEIARKVTG